MQSFRSSNIWPELRHVLISFSGCVTILWLFTNPIFQIPALTLGIEPSVRVYSIGLLLCMAIALLLNLERDEIILRVTDRTKIKVLAGNILESNQPNLAISIADSLDTDPKIISDESMTAQLVIAKYTDAAQARSDFMQAFGVGTTGRLTKTPVPAIAQVNPSGESIFLVSAFRMSEDNMVETDIPTLIAAYRKLWQKARASVDQKPLAVTLIGGGFGRLNISNLALLQMMILSFVSENQKQMITSELLIYLDTRTKDSIFTNELTNWFQTVVRGVTSR